MSDTDHPVTRLNRTAGDRGQPFAGGAPRADLARLATVVTARVTT
ncbi:MAG: hypothetical protein QOG97_3143, partial [Acidimicrobiaceae bacterium]|nr:hypothetical protein [Acidimicrobiaceae bacterium]